MECLSVPLRALTEAVDLLAAQVAVELPETQALAETAVLLRLVQRLQLVQLQRLADVDTRGLYALAEAPSTNSWLAAQQVELDRSQVALARALRDLPLVAAQVADASLPMRSAKLIDTALGKVGRFLDRPDGLLDGQPQEQVLQAVLLRGLPDLIGEALGGLAQDDPRLSELTGELTQICFEPVPPWPGWRRRWWCWPCTWNPRSSGRAGPAGRRAATRAVAGTRRPGAHRPRFHPAA